MTWQSKFLSVHKISPDGAQLLSLALSNFYLSPEYFRLFGRIGEPLYILRASKNSISACQKLLNSVNIRRLRCMEEEINLIDLFNVSMSHTEVFSRVFLIGGMFLSTGGFFTRCPEIHFSSDSRCFGSTLLLWHYCLSTYLSLLVCCCVCCPFAY